MIEDFNFSTLQSRFEQIKLSYTKDNYKYIHVKTVENFLYHANTFFTNHHKEQVFKTLSGYFNIIDREKIKSASQSRELFEKYLRPLSNLFHDLKGFHLVSQTWVIITWSLPLFGLLYFLNASIYFYIGLLVCVFYFLVRQLYFQRQRRTFGFMHELWYSANF